MPSRHAPPKAERPNLTTQQKLAGVKALKMRIEELQALDPDSINERFKDPRVIVLQTAIDESLSDMFGHETIEYDRYVGATRFDNGPIYAKTDWDNHDHSSEVREARQYLKEGKDRALSLLGQAVRRLEEEIATIQPDPLPSSTAGRGVPSQGRKVFIVHGHDEGMREAVARFLAHTGFIPIILHEQANQGRTVIEKVEAHGGNVGFAVVLLSPDDEGAAKGKTLMPRARQNALLELGYFIGFLGRKHVCALKRGDLELPSDFGGVVFEVFDEQAGWKQVLGRELVAAGYSIDWNKVMR